MALEGLLRDVQLASVIRVISRGRKTGALSVMEGDRDGIIYLVEGLPVDSVTEEASGDEALRILLQWKTGRFVFEENILSNKETISPALQDECIGVSFVPSVQSDEAEDEEPSENRGVLSVFSDILDQSSLGISSVAVVNLSNNEILAYSSILEKDRGALDGLMRVLVSVKQAASALERGDLHQVMLLDPQGWFIALQVRADIYLLCIASLRAKLGQLLFHLKKVRSWVESPGTPSE